MKHNIKYVQRFMSRTVAIIFTVIAVIVMGASTFLMILDTAKKSSCMPVDGIITYQNQHNVTTVIEYNVEGKDYEYVGSFYSSFQKVGQNIKVFVSYDNPADAYIRQPFVQILLMAIGGIFFTIGMLCLRSYNRFERNLMFLFRDGYKIRARVEGFENDYGYQVNNRPSTVLVAKDDNGNVYRSSPFFTKHDLRDLLDTRITVHVDRDDSTNYFVEIE